MRIEIYNNETKIDLDNIMFKDYSDEIKLKKDQFIKNELDFSSISLLKGEKTLMELSFQETKKELI
jgi:hypothetical protein